MAHTVPCETATRRISESLVADENLENTDDLFDESAKKSGPSMVVALVMLLVGAGAGGYFGGPVATPVMAEFLASDGEEKEDDGHGGGYGGGGGYGDEEEGPLTIDNLVLNPAGSGAQRFLIATLVLETEPDAHAELSARDAEVRDLLHIALASKTVDELADVSMRGVIREELRMSLNDLLGREGVHRIFFPTFVIQ